MRGREIEIERVINEKVRYIERKEETRNRDAWRDRVIYVYMYREREQSRSYDSPSHCTQDSSESSLCFLLFLARSALNRVQSGSFIG